jgi:ABC-2 type transport system ATP-binding protein
VEQICERVGIIREGQLVTVDHVATLKDLKQRIVEVTFPAPASADWLAALPGVSDVALAHGGHTLRMSVQGDLRDLLQVAADHGATNLVAHEPSLEEIFLRFYTSDGHAPSVDDRQAAAVGR